MGPLTNSELIAIVNANMKEGSGPQYELWNLACDELKQRIAGRVAAQQGGAYHRVDSIFNIEKVEKECSIIENHLDRITSKADSVGSAAEKVVYYLEKKGKMVKWTDDDMLCFAKIAFFKGPDEHKELLKAFAECE